jgi:two-component system chemotaxis response regulator CheY
MARILIVDDEPSMLFLLRTVLTGAGYEVLEAPDGAAALEFFAQGAPPDVVVTDVMMPVMDGRELIARLRADPATRAVPIIVHSGVQNPPEGADVVVKKPVGIGRLTELVEELIEARAE